MPYQPCLDVRLCTTPLSAQECIDAVAADECGALAVFLGTVRNHTQEKTVVRLEYEAYEPMALSTMRSIAEEVRARWKAYGVAIHHRIGTLHVGEVAVVVAVSTPHRQASFEACQYAIDTLKRIVPIWKKEIFTDGEVWVMPTP
jgi:molybdopterin synthase catalytic subunit